MPSTKSSKSQLLKPVRPPLYDGRLNIYVEQSDVNAVAVAAREDDRSINSWVRLAIKAALRERAQRKEEAATA
jgi:predicted HicB family RNase H-like nuclease